MESNINIQDYAAMMADIAKIETRKAALTDAHIEVGAISQEIVKNDTYETRERYLAASDKEATAKRVYKTALTAFLKRWSAERYDILYREVRFYNEDRPEKMYRLVRSAMMKEAQHIEF